MFFPFIKVLVNSSIKLALDVHYALDTYQIYFYFLKILFREIIWIILSMFSARKMKGWDYAFKSSWTRCALGQEGIQLYII